MAKLTFFDVLKNNLKCAFCREKGCPVRYMPESNSVVRCHWTNCREYDCPVRYMPERTRVICCHGTKTIKVCKKDWEASANAVEKWLYSEYDSMMKRHKEYKMKES